MLVDRITAGILLTVRLIILSAVGACCCITNNMNLVPPFELAAFCPENFAGLCKGLFPLLIIQNKSLLKAQLLYSYLLESRAATAHLAPSAQSTQPWVIGYFALLLRPIIIRKSCMTLLQEIAKHIYFWCRHKNI